MSTDETNGLPVQPENHTPKFIAIFVIIALLAIGQIYSLSKMNSMNETIQVEQAQLKKDLSGQLAGKLSAMEVANARQLSVLRADLDQTAERMGTTGKELNHARALVANLQKQQQSEASELKQQLSLKADGTAVGALSQDVSTTKSDLSSTRLNLDQLSKDLGMAKTEYGTLIARNHDDIEALRKLGDRDYYEFTLTKNLKQNLAGMGLTLKKTNVKHHRFDLNVLADDLQIEKKNRTVNEPIFFYVAGSKKPYELLVNKVESDRVTGYISIPKGAAQLASSS